LSENASQYGFVESNWSKLTHFQTSFIPNGLTHEDLLRASKDAFRRFYLRPKIVFDVLRLLTSMRALTGILLGFLAFLKTLTYRN
jgi:hypothetical protein